MLGFLQDKWQTTQLKARYQRLVHERLLNLTEASGPQPVSEDPGDWTLLGNGSRSVDSSPRSDARTKARHLVETIHTLATCLRLFEVYVTGPGLMLVHEARDPNSGSAVEDIIEVATRLWSEFLLINRIHYTFQEHARRTWRDGECFLRKFSQRSWPPEIRFR